MSDRILELFTDIRQTGNKAIHEHLDNKTDALRLVRACYDLGVWFHSTIMGIPEPPSFIPPAVPEAERFEYEALRAQLDACREHLVGTEFTLDDQSAELNEQAGLRAAEPQAPPWSQINIARDHGTAFAVQGGSQIIRYGSVGPSGQQGEGAEQL